MTILSRLLAVTALATSAALTASAFSTAPLAPVAMSRTTPFNIDAATPAISLVCAGTTPRVTLNAHVAVNKVYRYASYVNGVLSHTGYQQSNVLGMFSTATGVPNGRADKVVLKLNATPVVIGTVSPQCLFKVGSLVPGIVLPASTGARGSAGAYTLNHNANGTVTRWNPCDGNIHVRVNPTGGGAGALNDVITALGAISAATGLHFVYDGTTTFIPRATNSGSQPAALVIAWANRSQSDYLAAGAIGEGGWRSSGTSNDGLHWIWKISQGFVVLDPAAAVTPGFGRGVSRGSLLLHELGHVAGLGHTNESLQVMYPILGSGSYAGWGTGDKTGLSVVGAHNGCVTAH